MRYSMLEALRCPVTKEPLVVVGGIEEVRALPAPYASPATRVSRPGAVVGCMAGEGPSPLFNMLSALASRAAPETRNQEVIIKEGLLVAPNSGRWYPIIDEVPEVLPDSLRNWDRDRAFFNRISAILPSHLAETIRGAEATNSIIGPKPGEKHKLAELTALDKVDNIELFVGPGYISPFNPGNFYHSSELIRGFSCCIPFMKINLGAYVLDSGCGYSWTTEWLMKMGVHAIGLELVRRYVDTGRVRMGANQPDIVIADAENLPFKPTFFDAVLAFDAFHHIPNRNVAMREFSRVLKPGGNVVLVEPGGEVSPAAMQIMETLGTLEVGMELSDVREYVAGNGFDEPKETFLIPFSTADQRQVVPAEELRNRNFIGWCLYTVSKRAGEGHGGGLK